jgi:hypothetical protein
MESKESMTDISILVATLTQKVLQLQEKLDFLCKSTGNCELINKAHSDLGPGTPRPTITKETNVNNGTNINALCEEE